MQTARAVSKKGAPYWSMHAGRGVSRHAGGHMVLKHLGVLIQQPDASKGLSFMGAEEESDEEERDVSSVQWKPAQSKKERDDAVGRLQRLIQAWDKLLSTFKDAPTKCTEWSHKMREATRLLQEMPGQVPRLPAPGADQKAKYTSMWTFRSVMLLRMRQAGVKKLKVDSIGLQPFLCMNPDECLHMQRVFQANRATIRTTQEFLQHCSVRRPELLSMEMCLACDRGFDKVDMENIDVQRWKQVKDDLRKRHGMCPHISCIATRV